MQKKLTRSFLSVERGWSRTAYDVGPVKRTIAHWLRQETTISACYLVQNVQHNAPSKTGRPSVNPRGLCVSQSPPLCAQGTGACRDGWYGPVVSVLLVIVVAHPELSLTSPNISTTPSLSSSSSSSSPSSSSSSMSLQSLVPAHDAHIISWRAVKHDPTIVPGYDLSLEPLRNGRELVRPTVDWA